MAPQRARDFSRRLEAAGRYYLDSPISGGSQRAAEGALTILTSGSEAAFARAEPAIAAMGTTIYRLGDQVGQAAAFKMVNQLLGDPRQGGSTYIQLVNATFLRAAVAEAHRNRINILVDYLRRAVALGEQEGRQVRILNVGCGPAVELQRLIASGADLSRLSFTLLDFSRETLDYTRDRIDTVMAETGRRVEVNYVQESVHDLLKRPAQSQALEGGRGFDFIYCAGLFDYLSDKVCTRLIRYFMSRSAPGARMLLTNVHSSNPERHGMEHLLEWHLIYRDEAQMMSVMSEVGAAIDLYTDQTGVNVFAETTLTGRVPLDTA